MLRAIKHAAHPSGAVGRIAGGTASAGEKPLQDLRRVRRLEGRRSSLRRVHAQAGRSARRELPESRPCRQDRAGAEAWSACVRSPSVLCRA